MTIVPVLPVILQNGTTADANQVMANFDAIQSGINTNAAHNGANSDITSLSGLTTPLPITEGGTGAATAAGARDNLGITALLAALVTVPVGGTIIWNSPTNIPSGFFEENGQALSRTTYASLFTIIGTTFGAGDGSTTFNIPDSRGYFDRGWADTGSIDSGRAFGSTQADAFQTHTHGTSESPHTHSLNDLLSAAYVAGAYLGGPNGAGVSVTGSATTGLTVTAPNSGSTGAETRPVNIARMKIIRAI